jgi:uncharacterized protein
VSNEQCAASNPVLAAVAAGAINSVAGGGSFISFPALLLAGVPPISANATNATALWPGTLASVGAYRRELAVQRHGIVRFSAISLLGGLIGAFLLLRTQERTFEQLIPYLLLAATLIFALSPRITRWTRQWAAHERERWPSRLPVLALYFGIAVYGGFFGAGLGILTLAVLGLLGLEHIHEMNALKVHWPIALLMAAGGIVGGYGGAAIARRINPVAVRWVVIALSMSLTVYFFLR